MKDFVNNAQRACEELLYATYVLKQQVIEKADDLEPELLEDVEEADDQFDAAIEKIQQSLTIIEKTALDVVDMETRITEETDQLVSAAHKFEKAILSDVSLINELWTQVNEVEERLQDVACALFPSAVDGLGDVNRTLYAFTRRGWSQYKRLMKKTDVGEEDRRAVEQTFQELAAAFESTNEFLNDLALGNVDRSSFRDDYRRQADGLEQAVALARRQRERSSHRPFRPILDRVDDIVKDTKKAFEKVKVPLFPGHEELEELKGAITKDLYDSLSGPQKFALLNIAAQMRTIKTSEPHRSLMSEIFGIDVKRTYTDRFYFSAKRLLLETVKDHQEFDTAPAGLHRYRVGSFKQKTFRKANLQLSYDDTDELVYFDADIDLYRGPLSHLFGEVLVNHLSGSKTDQMKVKRILDKRQVTSVGGFTVERLA